MKKLAINKMKEYLTISLEEQMTLKGGDGYGSESNPVQLPEVVVYGRPGAFFGADGKVYSYKDYPGGIPKGSKKDCPGCQYYDSLNNPPSGGPVHSTIGTWIFRDIPHYFGAYGHKKH